MLQWVGGGPENDAVPAAVTVAAQHALADARHRRDERSLDKGDGSVSQPFPVVLLILM